MFVAFLTCRIRFNEIQRENLFVAFLTCRIRFYEIQRENFLNPVNQKFLKQILILNVLLLTVFICEGTKAIVGLREYHSGNNSVMGFSLQMEPNYL
jgi:hypothetical protein